MITGIRFIPLRKPGGDPVSHIGIFVEIKLSHPQSSDELCQHNKEALISPSGLSDTQHTNESLENATNTIHSDVTKLPSSNSGNEVHHKSLSCQQVIVTADVYNDSSYNTSSDC